MILLLKLLSPVCHASPRMWSCMSVRANFHLNLLHKSFIDTIACKSGVLWTLLRISTRDALKKKSRKGASWHNTRLFLTKHVHVLHFFSSSLYWFCTFAFYAHLNPYTNWNKCSNNFVTIIIIRKSITARLMWFSWHLLHLLFVQRSIETRNQTITIN